MTSKDSNIISMGQSYLQNPGKTTILKQAQNSLAPVINLIIQSLQKIALETLNFQIHPNLLLYDLDLRVNFKLHLPF